MAIRREAVRVRVPASSANVGPGFDTAGLAVALYDDLTAMATDDDGVLVEVSGEGCEQVPLDESHLVVRAMRLAFGALDERPAGFVLRCDNAIPHSRGLGSSAAAIVGGLVLARAMTVDGDQRLSDRDLLQLALTMEGHPDNLAAALFGGFTIAWIDDDGQADCVTMTPHPDVHPVLLVPPVELATSQARAVLGPTVDRPDAVANVARAALLVHAITTAPGRLMAATDDRLHQRARAVVYPDSMAQVDALRAAGVPAAISGAGPSVLAFAGDPTGTDVRVLAFADWLVRPIDVDASGATELPPAPPT